MNGRRTATGAALRHIFKALGLVLVLSAADGTAAASFDCTRARLYVERGICASPVLSALDDRIAAAFQAALRVANAPGELRRQQQRWVEEHRNRCQDDVCVQRASSERLLELQRHVQAQRVERQACAFPADKLPAEFTVLAAGEYSGRDLPFQIDESGHRATQIDVVVNHTAEPVALMLGAYEPTVWTVRWTPGSRIAAVLVSGYHAQAIAGLPQDIPVLNSTYDNRGPCGYFSAGINDLESINPVARRVFGRAAHRVYLARSGVAVVGEPLHAGANLVNPAAVPVESFRDPAAPSAGKAGLEDAVAAGVLRAASEADVDEWVAAQARTLPPRDQPAVDGQVLPRVRRPSLHNAYVVQKPFRFPAGLYADPGIFFIARGVPRPSGNPGHSDVYDFNTLRCVSGVCSTR
jgi:uncharacterized protein YecT (DUF1311 family)